ncbi:hypothetical protein ACIBAI_04480 [Streptomyces sp. NPDC051041]|uniref:hypothetical protein n=1 Tax=Streptomyces sp. NPDC051041 TaxID=3365640 RepID=UPI00378E3549
MAWDEWERLKAAAAERQSADTRLNSVTSGQGAAGGGGSGNSGRLRSSKSAWNRAGQGVGSLQEDIGKAMTKLEDGQKGLTDGAGCLTTAAQREVYGSWERYVKRVSGRCGKLAGIMEKVGSDLLKTDEAIRDEIAKLKAEYRDTPAAGGQPKGR